MGHIKPFTGYLIFKYVIYIGLVLFLVFPLYWIVSTSFRTHAEIMGSAPALFPQTFTLDNYRSVIDIGMPQNFLNSMVITITTVFISVAVGLFMAYAFAKRVFRGKYPLFATVLFTQFIPVIAYIIPLFLIMSRMQLLNTYRSLIITYLGNAFPVAVVLLYNYIRDVPVELEDAASIDGCSALGSLFRIVLPLSLPGIVSTSILIFISIWQEYLIAVSFISNSEAFTASMALMRFIGAWGTDWGGIMAGAVSISLPAVFLFLCTRKYFVYSLAGGVKG